jgi:LPXTG-motif cell wall-anchored protein
MDTVPWILVAIGLLVLILGVVVWKRRKESRPTDYRSYFTTGIIWIASGLILCLLPWLLHGEEFNSMGSFFLAMGLGYVIIGLINRDKWGKQVEVPPETRKKTYNHSWSRSTCRCISCSSIHNPIPSSTLTNRIVHTCSA